MLQINTGKLFQSGIGRTNKLRGVIYSNLRLLPNSSIVTKAGTLLSTGGFRKGKATVYEIDENIEHADGVLVSHSIGPYLQDFSVLTSFAFNVIATPDVDLKNRLTSGLPGLSSYHSPRDFMRRCFDKEVYLKDHEIREFEKFVDQLLGLKRSVFLSVMRAIRIYVSGVQRVYDDLALAYTLIISALESLAQDVDGYNTSWEDIDERKRKPIDVLFTEIESGLAERIREAIISVEHTSMGRRYKELALQHIDRSFFREGDALVGYPIARYEIEEALKQAYALRSRYVHNLKELPNSLTIPISHREVAYEQRKPIITLQGLSRLTRHVIKAVVFSSDTVEYEDYDYSLERAGIVTMPVAPQYWIWKPMENGSQAPKRFEGFLEQLSSVLNKEENDELTDLRPMLADIERIFPNSKKQYLPSMFALYWLFNTYIATEKRMPKYQDFIDSNKDKIDKFSSEMLIAKTLLEKEVDWPLDKQQEAHDKYFEKRSKPSGLHVPRIFEAAISIALAEKYRVEGNIEKTCELISIAVENYSTKLKLHKIETNFDKDMELDWRQILF